MALLIHDLTNNPAVMLVVAIMLACILYELEHARRRLSQCIRLRRTLRRWERRCRAPAHLR